MKYKTIFLDETKRKVVLVDKSAHIYHARRYLIDRYGVLINTHVMTLAQLARELSNEHLKSNGLEMLSREEALYLIESIMNDQALPMRYFNRNIISLNTYTQMLGTIYELKLAGLNIEDLKHLKSRKVDELSIIFEEYEKRLRENQCIDETDLFNIIPETAKDTEHFIFDNISFAPFEKRYFEQISNGKYTLIILPKPEGVDRPVSYSYGKNTLAEGEISTESFGRDKSAEGINVIRAYGENNEIRAVIKDILLKKIPLDQCMLLYTGGEYAERIISISDYYGVEITIQEGRKLDNTTPYYAVSQFLWYINNGSMTEDLLPLFRSETLNLNIEKSNVEFASNGEIADYLVSLRVNTGALRLHEKLIEKAEEATSDESLVVEGLISFINLLAKLENQSIDTDTWLDHLKELLKYVNIPNDEIAASSNNSDALSAILETINSYQKGPCSYPNVSVKWLYELEQRLKGARKEMNNPSPGKLHVARYSNVICTTRPHVYVVGLDAGHFPESGGEQSILNNSERLRLSADLRLEPKKSDSVYKLWEVLNNVKESITLVYSYYDTVKVNDINASTFINKVLENPDVEVKDIGFVPSEREEVISPVESLISDPKNLIDSSNFTEDIESHNWSTFVEANSFSASQIETMASCRKKYYFKYIMGVPEIKADVPGHMGWLNPLDRGTLLHEILEYVINKLNTSSDIDLEQIAIYGCNEKFVEMEKVVPVTIRSHYNSLYDTFIDAVLRYSKNYLELKKEGLVKSSLSEMNFKEEIEIRNKDESLSIKLNGKIDRVDFNSDGTISIIDYKSGKPFDKTKGNKDMLQDYLYSQAAERLFKDVEGFKGIREARYDFPLEHNDGVYWKMEETKLETLTEEKAAIVFDSITDISNGNFVRTTNRQICAYCSYVLHCRPHLYGGDE